MAYHADLSRVGERAYLPELLTDRPALISRLAPGFSQPGADTPAPLADPCISRRPLRLEPTGDAGIRVVVPPGAEDVVIDGERVAESTHIPEDALERGVVLELAWRVVLLLHRLEPTHRSTEDYGLVGENDRMQRLRADIRRVADLDVPVLILGESGTGKELVARAIHQASPRSGAPFLSLNMAAIPASTAASALFGHRRGAFTGAEQSSRGYFGAAEGGTLFLDEVGAAPLDVQNMLLRALESGEVQPIGDTQPHKVHVRLVAATDADLGSAVEAGAFRLSLFHRLAGYQLALPPLQGRRDDVPRLFMRFLRDELEEVGELGRFDVPADRWLPPELMVRLLQDSWPGNVRQLKNVVRQLVISNRGRRVLRLDASLENTLGDPSPLERAAAATPPPAPVTRRQADVGGDELVEALRACQWQPAKAAKRLGLSKPAIYRLIERSDRVRKAGDLTVEELTAVRDACDGDLGRMAAQLEVSRRGLQLRLKQVELA